MAGLYLHVPFCRQACHYCDFHFSTSRTNADALIDAMAKELSLRKDFLAGETLSTIYFGGGTPSLLTAKQLEKLFSAIRKNFLIQENAEITLEANPDDISKETLPVWKAFGVNRLSIGIQSFQDADLRFMNRAHSAAEAIAAISVARQFDFHDLTIDLIYGTPTMNDEAWEQNLSLLEQLDLPHFSAYALTVEPRTALAQFVRNRMVPQPAEEQAAAQFQYLMDWSRKAGYEQYEISNFAKPQRYSRHNTAYWQGISYLGIGPSAHSFDGRQRTWNIRNNPEYIRKLESGELFFEIEVLSENNRYNEYVMTALRTCWGISREKLANEFGVTVLESIENPLVKFKTYGWVADDGKSIWLTDQGKLFADHIASELFR